MFLLIKYKKNIYELTSVQGKLIHSDFITKAIKENST